MAKVEAKELFGRILVDFVHEKYPLLSMLEWTAQRLIEIES